VREDCYPCPVRSLHNVPWSVSDNVDRSIVISDRLLHIDVSATNFNKLQRVQDSLARVVLRFSRRDNIPFTRYNWLFNRFDNRLYRVRVVSCKRDLTVHLQFCFCIRTAWQWPSVCDRVTFRVATITLNVLRFNVTLRPEIFAIIQPEPVNAPSYLHCVW